MLIEIDPHSGFCHGVTTAIKKAEEELKLSGSLYCLGDIVHNGSECDRLRQLGLVSIEHEALGALHDAKLLFRAHGEPPSTYEIAKNNNISIIDATCPVVLHLQKIIKEAYANTRDSNIQIVIYGKNGHAEVVGLVGQTEGNAIVVEDLNDASKLDFSRGIYLYSQTTKSLDGFEEIVDFISKNIKPSVPFQFFDTICRQVANRIENIRNFAKLHDVVIFVSGTKSSNGRVLYNECLDANKNSYMISDPSEISLEWFSPDCSVGICGATSTPKWLMEQCRDFLQNIG